MLIIFLAFQDLTCHLEDTGIGVFWLHCVVAQASQSASKNTRVVLAPCPHMEVHPYNYFHWCGYFWGPGVPENFESHNCLPFCWPSIHIQNGMPGFIAKLMTILVLIKMVFVIFWDMRHGMMSLNSVLLLLLVNFVNGFRLELMYISFIESIRSSLTHLHGFQLLVQLL